ncbi:MAG: tetratricopeptide repeat protein [Bacteroidales bacterium]|nr:tetratricopeptide repeat protein [Bacteroidales bacterium]
MDYTKFIKPYINDELNDEEKKLFEESLKFKPELLKEIKQLAKTSLFIKEQRKLFPDLKKNNHSNNSEKEENNNTNINTDTNNNTNTNINISTNTNLDTDTISKDEILNDINNYKSTKPETEDILELREKLEKGYENYIKTENKERNLNLNIWYYVAASVILIVAIGSMFLFFQNKTYSSEEIFSMYYKPLEENIITRSAEQNSNYLLNNALYQYSNHEYQEAIEFFNKMPQNEINYAIQLYKGISYIETQNYELAILSFNDIITSGDNPFTIYAKWYLGLCYLKDNQKDKAISIFKEIQNKYSYYSENSTEILEKL